MIRGEIWWVDPGIPFGSEPGFRRPVLVVQADAFTISRINTVICVPLTTNLLLEKAPGNTLVRAEESGLSKDSVVIVSQLTVLDKARFDEPAGVIHSKTMRLVENGIRLVLNLS